MADWQTVDGSELFPEGVEELLGIISTGIDVVEGVVEGAQGTLETLLSLFDALDNPIITLIDDLINDIVQTRVSALYIAPTFSRRDLPGGLSKFGRTMTAAFQDTTDSERPTFESDDISGGVIININAPSFAEIADLINLFKSLFGDGWSQITDLVRGFPGVDMPFFQPDVIGTVTGFTGLQSRKTGFIDEALISPTNVDLFSGRTIKMITGKSADRFSRIDTFTPETGVFTLTEPFPAELELGDGFTVSEFRPARPPNWESVPLTEVMPPINSLVSILAALRAQLSPLSVPFGAFIRILEQLERVLSQKLLTLQLIQNQLDELQAVIDGLATLTNINVLAIPFEEGGNGRFIQEFELAGNAPPVDDDNVSVGIVLYGGAGTSAVFSKVFSGLF